jgi:hypothetical protein
LGHLLPRGRLGFEAFDSDDQSIGVYSNHRLAADALTQAARGHP